MKKLILLIILLGYKSSYSQLYNSSCIPKDSFDLRYRNTADLLTLRRTYWDNKPYKDSAQINPKLKDTFYKCLATVYNIPNLKALDTIFRILYIKNDEWLDQIAITSDTNLLFSKNLKHNIFPTTNDTLDAIMNKYFYLPDSTQGLESYGEPLFSRAIKSTKNWNRPVIVKELKNIKSIRYLSEGFAYTNYNTYVLDSIFPTHMILRFAFGWGDCPAGCTAWRIWRFKVYYDCKVEYLGSIGLPLPFATNAVLEYQKDEIQIYPNPIKNKISLTFDSPKNLYFTISDLTGKKLLEKTKLEKTKEIELGEKFNNGIYFLNLYEDESLIKVSKFSIER